MHQRYIDVENIVRKEEIAGNKQFLLYSQCFLPYTTLFFLPIKCALKCRLQFVSVWTSLKLSSLNGQINMIKLQMRHYTKVPLADAIGLYRARLTHSHTTTPFDAPGKQAF